MTDTTRRAEEGPSGREIVPVLSSRFPGLMALGVLLLLIWVSATMLLRQTWQEREVEAFQLVNDHAREAAERVARLFKDADQTLLNLRARYVAGDDMISALEHWPWAADTTRNPATQAIRDAARDTARETAKETEGIALIAPDGHIVAASPHVSTMGWPRLMAQLAASDDVLAVGEPIAGKNGRSGLVPVARRVIRPDGSFGGILFYALDGDVVSRVPLPLAEFDPSVSLVDDDGVVLARTPNLPGSVFVRVTHPPPFRGPEGQLAGLGHHISELDGVDRIYAFRHLSFVPVTLIAGAGADAMFDFWTAFQIRVISLASLATALIFLTGLFWFAKRRQTEIAIDALTVVLANLEQGVRVERPDGAIVAANNAGLMLPAPDSENPCAESWREDDGTSQVTRHDLRRGGAVLIGTDLTSRDAAAARIEFLTNHDTLTGLPNRWRAASRIQDLLAEKSGSPRMAALILFDLDGFQDINDTLGHEGGDEVLTEVARRLRDLVSDRDVVARLGGAEFLLFLEEPDDKAVVMSLTRHIPRTLARPIAVRGQQVRLGASMGIAFYPRDGADAATLFRHANIALTRAKMAGRGTAKSFEPMMMASFEEHRMMESDLRRALDDNELELCLQPQFSCDSLEVTGFEALTRWRHPVRGDVSPAVFIPVAERSGLINPLGLWAIEQACVYAATWPARHRVAVNLSPLQLRCETIQEDIRGILRRTQFPAHLLELEVTENVLLDEDQRTLEMLHKLRAMDIRITLDDFGTGYSSLSYLRRFPFDKIKIDKSFIQGQSTDRGTRVILEAMIRMCSDLGFDVVGEGVETEQQLNELRRLECQEVQGFLLGVPLRPGAVEDFLTGHVRRPAATKVQSGSLTTT